MVFTAAAVKCHLFNFSFLSFGGDFLADGGRPLSLSPSGVFADS
jgi:hypothetical protein